MMKTVRNTEIFKRLSGIAIALAVFLCVPAMFAQNTTGSITGTVADPSGAVIPGARVTAVNVDTTVKTESTTNGSGAYTIRFLPIGTYRVTVTAPGFGSQEVPQFALEASQTVKINASLQVGASATTVDVHDNTAPLLNTTDATLADTFTANQLANLPLNGGNFAQAAMFSAGVVANPNGFSGVQAIERDTSFSATVSVAGNRAQENDYTLEGADNNEPQQNLIAYNPAVEALGEVRTVSANAAVTYGNSNGGSIVSVLKSGTNQFHGSAYMYLQDYKLDTNSWQNKHATPMVPKNPYTQTIFGGTLGGPILRSKKLFFFGDYKGARNHTAGYVLDSVMPDAWRMGDFSSLLTPPTVNGDPQYKPIQLYDTQNNFAPYVNNQVPIVNPVARYLFAHPELYPRANSVPSDGLAANNYQAPQKKFTVNNQYDIKIDWNPGNANQFSAFYSSGRSYDGQTQVFPATFPAPSLYPDHIGGGSWIHTFSSAIVNEARVGFTRVRWDQQIVSDPSGVFGYKGNSIVGIPFGTQYYPGFSAQNFGLTGLGTTGSPALLVRDNTFRYSDNLTWQHGPHLFTIGAQARRYQQNYLNGNFGFLGSFNYDGEFTSNPRAANGPGYAPADFVLDRVHNPQLGSGNLRVGNRQWRMAGYVQDDWKATPKLTLNLGLRYEFDQPWYEQHNKTANVVFQNGVPVVEYAGAIPANAVPGSIICPTRACYYSPKTQFMPRIGFAYQSSPRIVVRGGFAATSFLEGDNFNQRLTSSPPFVSGINAQANVANGDVPFTVEDGFSQQVSVSNNTFSVWPQNQRPAYIYQYNLTAEYALTNTLSLSVGYLGETGNHLSDYGYPNQWTIAQANIFSLLPKEIQENQALWPASLNTLYSSLPGAGTNSRSVLETESRAMMNYNGLLTTLRQRVSRGLEFTANYTYSKSLSNNTIGNYGGPPSNYFDLSRDYGPANNDVRHNITFNGVYDLPFGKGRTYGAGMNRALDLLVGGWKLSATLVNYTGVPVSITATNTTGISGVTGRANHYRPFKIVHRSLSHWWGTDPSVTPCLAADNNICAYGAQPSPLLPGMRAFGTAAFNSERAPGYRQVDSSLFKDFHIYGEHTIGFRANVYNLFNIASYAGPDTNGSPGSFGGASSNSVGDPGFGVISGVNSPPRQVELSAHYNF